jgi:DedD protein
MMERALKERIIGAIVLVIFVVLVVPIFLDGPPQEGEIVSERVLLPGQEDQSMKVVILDRERTEPMPVTNTSGQSNDTPDPTTTEPAPVVEKPPAQVEEKPTPKPETRSPVVQSAPASGMWAVQLGSFSNKENAEKLAADLRKQGYAAFLSQVGTSSGQLHRVRIGPQKDRDSAEAMAARLLKVGHKGQVLPHP